VTAIELFGRIAWPWNGTWAEPLFDVPAKILAVVVVGVVARHVLHRVIDRVCRGIAEGTAGLARIDDRLPQATARVVSSALLADRREQRARTIASVLKSLATAVVGGVVALTCLELTSVPVAPLLASASVVGVAVGFGAQSLVKDVISGLFMMTEDQYGVGDVVDLGDASGVVEAVGLRVTRLRDVNGTVWYVRNGEVQRVGNSSQGWARAVLDVAIAYGEDVARAEHLLLDVALELGRDPEYGSLLQEEPQVWGVEQVSADGVVIRLVVKTEPLEQWKVARELRRRIKAGFDEAGILVAHAASTVVMARSRTGPGSGSGPGPGPQPQDDS
jgi:small conductance mechanosensitive channel